MFGTDVVLFRGDDGAPHMVDAYCAHLGAHIGVGGRVEGDCIRCPFHGWRYDGDTGQCNEIPYGDMERIPSAGADPLVPVHRAQPDDLGVAPRRAGRARSTTCPRSPELFDPEWLPYEIVEFDVATCCQEMAENNVDFAHFMYVHGTDAIPDDDFFVDGTYKRTVGADGNFVREGFGLGLGVLRVKGYTTFISSTTPIDDREREGALDLHRARRERRRRGATSRGEAFSAGVSQDLPIWENKRYVERPVVTKSEKKLLEQRQWAKQFYSNYAATRADVDDGAGSVSTASTSAISSASVKFYEALGLAEHEPHRSRHDQGSDRREPRQGRQAPARAEARRRRPDRHGQRVLEALRRDERHREDVRRRRRRRRRGRDRSRMRLDQWPMSIALREGPRRLSRRAHAAPSVEGRRRPTTHAWLNQYCIYVSDLERTIAFYELLGLGVHEPHRHPARTRKRSSRTPSSGGKIQLAQQLDNDAPIAMGSAMWKLYVNTDDCEALHRARGRGRATRRSWIRCSRDRWPVTISFLADPDGYQVELVERHADT